MDSTCFGVGAMSQAQNGKGQHKFKGQRKLRRKFFTKNSKSADVTRLQVNANAANSSKSRVMIAVKNGEASAQSLYDTGAQGSVMHSDAFKKAIESGSTFKTLPTARLQGVTGDDFPVERTVRIVTSILNKKVSAVWHISPAIAYEAIIGMNIIRAGLNLVQGEVSWDASKNADTFVLAPIGSTTHQWATAGVFPKRHILIEPGEAKRVRVYVKDEKGNKVGQGQALVDIGGIMSLIRLDEYSSAQVFIQNPRNKDPRRDEVLELRPSESCGWAYEADQLKVIPAEQAGEEVQKIASLFDFTLPKRIATSRTSTALQKRRLTGMKKQHWEAITEQVEAACGHITSRRNRAKLTDLLKKYAEVFSANKFDVGRSEDHKHTIRLKSADPVFTKQYPMPAQEVEFVKEHVRKWLELGLIEPANSPYNSPIFCVSKKGDDGWRLVLDYRKLNAQSHIDRYSIRSVDECLNEVGKAASSIFSALDLTAGFYQLPLDSKVKHTTAFTVPGMGQYQWLAAPMGLQGSPSSFSRLMDKVLLDVPNTVTFVDDILVHSRSFDAHLNNLEQVFARLSRAGLKLNLTKCMIARTEVPYLGHTLSAKGISPGKDKFAALMDTRAPETISDLRSFLGLANFFRKFVPNFAQKAVPLHALTRQGSKWTKGPMPEEAVRTFDALKKDISSAPHLALPRPRGSFHLYVDASTGSFDEGTEGGLGACLAQDQDGTMVPIAFASRALRDAERNYSAFLLEQAAAVYAMEHFRHLLRGTRFYLYTDNRPVKDMSSTQARTLNRLQEKKLEFDVEIRHTPGGAYNPADFLSRSHAKDNTVKRICQLTQIADEYPAWT